MRGTKRKKPRRASLLCSSLAWCADTSLLAMSARVAVDAISLMMCPSSTLDGQLV